MMLIVIVGVSLSSPKLKHALEHARIHETELMLSVHHQGFWEKIILWAIQG